MNLSTPSRSGLRALWITTLLLSNLALVGEAGAQEEPRYNRIARRLLCTEGRRDSPGCSPPSR